jgi:hypothetical protein
MQAPARSKALWEIGFLASVISSFSIADEGPFLWSYASKCTIPMNGDRKCERMIPNGNPAMKAVSITSIAAQCKSLSHDSVEEMPFSLEIISDRNGGKHRYHFDQSGPSADKLLQAKTSITLAAANGLSFEVHIPPAEPKRCTEGKPCNIPPTECEVKFSGTGKKPD